MYSLMKTIVEMPNLHKYVETKDTREWGVLPTLRYEPII